MLYHYTSLSTLCNMLAPTNRDKDSVTFWATDVLCMNDPKELTYGENEVKNFIRKYEHEQNIKDGDKISSVIDESSNINLFKKLGNFYAISLSKESDSLPMWQTYGDKGRGINIIIKDKGMNGEIYDNKKLPIKQRADNLFAQTLHTLFRKNEIEYGEIASTGSCGKTIISRYNKYLEDLCLQNTIVDREFAKMQVFVDMLYIGAQSIKSASYSYEKEERLYCIPTEKPKYRLNYLGHIIPLIPQHFSLTFFISS